MLRCPARSGDGDLKLCLGRFHATMAAALNAMRLFLPLAVSLLPVLALAQAQSRTADELIAGLRAARPPSGIYARLRLEHSGEGGKSTTLQVQVKRRTAPDGGTESLYQVLFPRERKGEGLLLRIKDGNFTGAGFVPGAGVRSLKSSDRNLGLFGTALTVDDIIAAFLQWPVQEIVGHENVGNVPCTIVESRGGKALSSGTKRVRSWIDESRLAAMRVEKFAGSDQPVKIVVTHKVMRGSSGYFAPTSFTVTDHSSGAVTQVEGVRSESDIVYTDADFTGTALQSITAPSGKSGS